MGILDNILPQQGVKHQDPEVRLAALQELGDEQHETLLALAREDDDPRVRLAAVGRLDDPRALGEISNRDDDRKVRHRAVEALIRIATEDSDRVRCEQAASVMSEAKHLARIARTAAYPEVRRHALGRLDDARALGSVARHADDSAIRGAAVERLTDTDELAQIALKGEHHDAALAAVARISDRAVLQMLAGRVADEKLQEAVAGRLASIEPEPPPVDLEAVQVERAQLCHDLEFLVHDDNWERVRNRMAAVAARWEELPGRVEPDSGRRYAAAREVLEERLQRHDSEEAAARRRQMDIESALEQRAALCAVVEASDGPGVPERLQEARAAWQRLAPLSHPDAAQFERRFEQGLRDGESRYQTWQEEHARRSRRELLVGEIEALLVPEDPDSSPDRWKELRKAWREIGGKGDRDLQERFAQAARQHRERESSLKADREQQEADNLQRLQSLCDRLEKRAAAENLTLKEADHGQKEVRAALDDPGPLPAARDREAAVKRLTALRAAFGTRIRELREISEWKRWANSGVQEELCGQLEALIAAPDIERAARLLRDIERMWRQARAAPRDQEEPLRQRFETARSALRARCDEYFARQAEERSSNLKLKEELCAQVEALATATDWVKTAERIKQLQSEWRKVGPVQRDQARVIWERFRAACDRFFSRRKEDLDSRKKVWADNATRKEALCEQAEALAASSQWEETAAAFKRLQSEWKAIGAVRKGRSEALWRRFRKACDAFFERYRQRDKIDLEAKVAAAEEVCAGLEAALPAGDAAPPQPPEGLKESVLALKRRWEDEAGLPQHQYEGVWERYLTALQKPAVAYPDLFRGTDLDFASTRDRMAHLCARVEAALSTVEARRPAGASPATILAMQLREALAANTIGGKADVEAKWRSATAEVKEAQAAWNRLGLVPGDAAAALSARFNDACRRFRSLRPPSEPPARQQRGRAR
jgi:hypothetical protein